MCDLHSMARSRDEVRALFRADQDSTANLPPLPARWGSLRLNASRTTAARALDRLEHLGLVRRAGLRPYRRGVPAEGTEAGRAFVQQLGATMLAATSSTTSAPSPLR